MSPIIEDFLKQAMQLPLEQRAELADKLLESLHPQGDQAEPEEIKAAWVDECQRRMAESDAGVPSVPLEEAWTRIAGKYV